MLSLFAVDFAVSCASCAEAGVRDDGAFEDDDASNNDASNDVSNNDASNDVPNNDASNDASNNDASNDVPNNDASNDASNDVSNDDVADRLFFGKAASASLSRRVFECCRVPALGEGYVFVRLRLRYEGKTPILQVVAERKNEAPMTVSDCATLSRFLSPLLEGEGLVSSQTRLEVSSPGLERPLTRLRDFQRFAGREIALELDKQKACRSPRKFRATLAGVEGGLVVVQTPDERLSLPIADLVKAQLVVASSLPGFARR